MSELARLERAVEALTPEEFDVFREWFAQYEAARFDHAIERDATSGLLDQLGDEALAEWDAGRARRL